MPIPIIAWWKNKKCARPIAGGKRVKRRCPECGETTHFRECEVKHDLSVYSVKLWDDQYRAFACSACDALMALDETLEPELSAREQRKLDAEKKKASDQARRELQQAEADKERQVDAELEALRRKLGK